MTKAEFDNIYDGIGQVIESVKGDDKLPKIAKASTIGVLMGFRERFTEKFAPPVYPDGDDLDTASTQYEQKLVETNGTDDNGNPLIGKFVISETFESGVKWYREKLVKWAKGKLDVSWPKDVGWAY